MLYKVLTLPLTKKFELIPKVVFDIIFYSIMGFTFLGCSNFLGQQGIFILISIVLMLAYIVLKRKIKISLFLILSIVFALSYSISCLIYNKGSIFSAILYTFMLPIIILFFDTQEDKKRFIIWMCVSILSGFLLAFTLLTINTVWHQGFVSKGETFDDVWNNGVVLRTGISLYEMAIIAILFATLFFKNTFRRFYTIPLFIILLAILFIVPVFVGNRSFLISFFFIVYSILSIKMFSPKFGKFWTAMLIIFNLLLIGFLAIYWLNSRGIIVLPEELLRIKIIERIFKGDLNQGRVVLWGEFFSKFYKYPFGGLFNGMGQYTHNIFLDFYSVAGAIPCLLFLTFFVFLIIWLVKFLNRRTHTLYEKAIVLGIIVGTFSIGFIEPIYMANPNCLTPIFLLFLYLKYDNETSKSLESKSLSSNLS